MQRDYGDGDGIISQVRSNGNEGKKRRKSRGEMQKKLKVAPRLPDYHSGREHCTLQYMIKDASESGNTFLFFKTPDSISCRCFY